MRQYTIIYAITRDLRWGNAPPQHECYHHLARVTAPDPLAAQELCRADTLPGFSYETLAIFEGHLVALGVGDRVLSHSYDASKKEP